MTTTTAAPFTHRHSLSYQHSIATGWANVTDRYGKTHGACRECGERIVQLVEAGVAPVNNRHPFRTDAELAAIDAAHDEALAMNAERDAAELDRAARRAMSDDERAAYADTLRWGVAPLPGPYHFLVERAAMDRPDGFRVWPSLDDYAAAAVEVRARLAA